MDFRAAVGRTACRVKIRACLEGFGCKPYRVAMLRKSSEITVVAMLLIFTVTVSAAGPQLSREPAERLAKKIEEINKNAAADPVRSKTTEISELEVNSYLAFNLKDEIPRGLADAEIRMLGDRQLAGRVYVDIDEFKRSRGSRGMVDPFNYISGQVPVTARGLLRTTHGSGQFQLVSAEIHGVPLPKAIVQELVSFFSRTSENPNGFNLDAPFTLPAKIRDVAVQKGQAWVVQ